MEKPSEVSRLINRFVESSKEHTGPIEAIGTAPYRDRRFCFQLTLPMQLDQAIGQHLQTKAMEHKASANMLLKGVVYEKPTCATPAALRVDLPNVPFHNADNLREMVRSFSTDELGYLYGQLEPNDNPAAIDWPKISFLTNFIKMSNPNDLYPMIYTIGASILLKILKDAILEFICTMTKFSKSWTPPPFIDSPIANGANIWVQSGPSV